MTEWVANLTTTDLEQLRRDLDDTRSTPTDEAVQRELDRRCSLPNRWAAFSDDELAAITEATDYLMLGDPARLEYLHGILDHLMPEIRAELERRKT